MLNEYKHMQAFFSIYKTKLSYVHSLHACIVCTRSHTMPWSYGSRRHSNWESQNGKKVSVQKQNLNSPLTTPMDDIYSYRAANNFYFCLILVRTVACDNDDRQCCYSRAFLTDTVYNALSVQRHSVIQTSDARVIPSPALSSVSISHFIFPANNQRKQPTERKKKSKM